MRDLLPHLNLSGWWASPTVILLLSFVALVWWVMRSDSRSIQEASELPLKDEIEENQSKTDGQERRRAS